MSDSAMAYLLERVRTILGDDPRISEKTMFGGRTFLLNGHILVGCKKDGRILVPVGKDGMEAALAKSGVEQMMMGQRKAKGFVWVEADAIEDDDDLAAWITTAEQWVRTLPPK